MGWFCVFLSGIQMGIFKLTKAGAATTALAIALAGAAAVHADQYAVMNTGTRVRIEAHQEQGALTELSLPGGGSVQVNSAYIVRFESDEYVPPPPPSEKDEHSQASTHKGNLDRIIHEAGARHGLDPDLLHSVIAAESGGNPAAVSPRGARGLMQLMPRTARQLNVSNALDPAQNLEGGTRYLRELLARYGDNRLDLALAAYNAGPEKVDAYGKKIPPYRETVNYVRRIITDFNRRKLAGD